jgi:hypothetical protein
VRGSCAHLAGVVKSNSSGIEVWRGSLIQAGSRSKVVFDRGAVESFESTSTWIRGDRQFIDTIGKILVSCPVTSLLNLFLQFSLSVLFY